MKPAALLAPKPRIDLIDALRGSALMGIVLLHSLQHWSFEKAPDHTATWLEPSDGAADDLVEFLFYGKAYGIFAMLFGVSFFLILDRWSKRETHFRARFLWRLTILALFGFLNGIVYCSDVLLVFAVLGIPLVLLYKLKDWALIFLAVILLLPAASWWQTEGVLIVKAATKRHGLSFSKERVTVFANGSWPDVAMLNLRKSAPERFRRLSETGRGVQMMGLFICGLLIGRRRIFEDAHRLMRMAKHCVIWGVAGFALTYPLKLQLDDMELMTRDPTVYLVSAYCHLAQMAIWVGTFILLYQWTKARAVLQLLAPYGRMSLTCYVMQGAIGVILFYGFGFALYHWLGPFYSVLVGIGLFLGQCIFAHYWMRRFNYGPLEWLWRCLTFLNFSTPLRKVPHAGPVD